MFDFYAAVIEIVHTCKPCNVNKEKRTKQGTTACIARHNLINNNVINLHTNLFILAFPKLLQ